MCVRPSDFDEARANSHGSPISQSAHRDFATIALGDFLDGQKFSVYHSFLRRVIKVERPDTHIGFNL